VVQTLNAIKFARHLGLKSLRLVQMPGLDLTDPILREGLTLLPQTTPLPPDGVFLDGDFHYRRQFGNVFAGFDREAQYELCQNWLRPLLQFPHVVSPPADDELVIHLRSGDIFGSQPHPNYRQPPLSFYQSVIQFLKPRGIDRVCLVYEDRGNPCIAALETWLELVRLPFRSQSGTVEEDIAFLLQAKHLVFGTGTFGFGICLLAGSIETIHAFDQWGLYENLPNINTLRLAQDIDSGYIPKNGWTNSPEQRNLMLDFPANLLAFRDS
jgi:hypothetical protein